MSRQITLSQPGSPGQDGGNAPPSPVLTTWASIRALRGAELDKMEQIAQEADHLVSIPYQQPVSLAMLVDFEGRTFQIAYIEDEDERHIFLDLYCHEIGQNAGSLGIFAGSPAPYIPPPPSGGGGSGGGTSEDDLPSLIYHIPAASSTNAALIKNAAGTVTGWKIYNNAGYPIYVKLFDKGSGTPSVGSDTPKQTIGVDAGESDVVSTGSGWTYVNGIGIAIVKGIADNDNTPVAALDCVCDVFYR